MSGQVTECCGYHDPDVIRWNQHNGVVQCHNCGHVYVPQRVVSSSLDNALVRFYAYEMNIGLQSFWDGGFTVWIGDEANGIRERASFDIHQIAQAADFLLSSPLLPENWRKKP